MQGLKFYILIESEENEAEVRIDGNLETLRELLHTLRAELAAPAPVTALPAEDSKQTQGGSNATH